MEEALAARLSSSFGGVLNRETVHAVAERPVRLEPVDEIELEAVEVPIPHRADPGVDDETPRFGVSRVEHRAVTARHVAPSARPRPARAEKQAENKGFSTLLLSLFLFRTERLRAAIVSSAPVFFFRPPLRLPDLNEGLTNAESGV